MNWVEWAIGAAIIGILLAMGFGLYIETTERSACHLLGYPKVTRSVGGGSFCVRLENGTEVMRPLSELQK